MEKLFYFKTYKREHGLLVAVCDKEVCGRKLKAGDVEFFVNPRFYNGGEGDENQVAEALRASFAANLVGEKAVELGVKLGLVDPEQVKKIEEIPHAQIVIMQI